MRKKSGSNGILTDYHLPFARRIQPSMIAFHQQRTSRLSFGSLLRLEFKKNPAGTNLRPSSTVAKFWHEIIIGDQLDAFLREQRTAVGQS